jgi:hypothetical protein
MHQERSECSLLLLVVLMIATLILAVPQTSTAQPRPVTKADLEELKDGDVPKNAKKQFMWAACLPACPSHPILLTHKVPHPSGVGSSASRHC